MASTCDILIDNQFKIHLGIFPDLCLLVVNELEDFAENWLEIKAIANSKFQISYDVNTLSGSQDDGSLEAVARYLVDIVRSELYKSGPTLEQVGLLLKFNMNIRLRPEILKNRLHIMSLGTALSSLLRESRNRLNS